MSAIATETRLAMLEDEVDKAGVRELYEQVLAGGAGAEFAAMCALRSPPGGKNTDRSFQEGARRQMDRMDPENRKLLYQRAQAAGINTQGKYYKSGLGRHTDPEAWVATAQDVVDVAKRKKLDVSGVVNVKAATDKPKEPGPRLAPDLVADIIGKKLMREPALREKVMKNPQRELKRLQGETVEKHGRRKT